MPFPDFAIASSGLHGLVERWARDLLASEPAGAPYRVAGYSLGCAFAVELAGRLLARGQPVEQVILLDGGCPVGRDDAFDAIDYLHALAKDLAGERVPALETLRESGLAAAIDAMAEAVAAVSGGTAAESRGFVEALLGAADRQMVQIADWQPPRLELPITLLRTEGNDDDERPEDYGWGAALGRPIEVQRVPGDHFTMLRPPHASTTAAAIEALLGPVPASE
jgi:thioesterase domain-containing protein